MFKFHWILVLGLSGLLLTGCSGDGLDKTPTTALEGYDGTQLLDVVINHGYQPNVIETKAGYPLDLTFTRKEITESCARELVVPVAGFKGVIPNGERVVVHIPAQEAGEYPFHCSMNMMKGIIRFVAEPGR